MKKNIVKFIHISARYPKLERFITNSGWYFTKYNEETKEGEGYFSSERGPVYDFKRRIFDGQLMESTCGYGEGCVWSEWRETVESVKKCGGTKMNTFDKIIAELKKAKENNPDLNVGRIMYFVQCLAEDSREKSIHDVSDEEFLDMLKTVCYSFKYIQ